jgi:AcrR family transcriptional regulator
MRDIAEVVGIRAPALYNHFKNKHALYLAAVSHAFAHKSEALSAVFAHAAPPAILLHNLVTCLCDLLNNDTNFRLLIQRELLDGDEARLKFLAREIFAEHFKATQQLAKQLDPTCDAHMLAISIAALAIYHFEFGPLRRFLPGSQPEHEEPHYIAEHIIRLLLNGLGQGHEQ